MKLKLIIFSLFVIFCCAQDDAAATAAAPAAATAATKSGINVALLPAAWNKIVQSYLPYSLCKSTHFMLPEFVFMGYTFSQAMFKSITVDPANTKITLNDGWMTVEATQVAYTMDAMASQSTGEDASIGAQPITITTDSATITFGMIPFQRDGQMQFKIDNVTTDVGNVQVNAQQGFLSKINTQLKSNTILKNNMNKQFALFIKDNFANKLNDYGMTYPIVQHIPKTQFSLDDGLVQDPVITTQASTWLMNGTIFVTGNDTAGIAFEPSTMPLVDTTAQQEFQIFINDYVFNSYLANAWGNSLLEFNFPKDVSDLMNKNDVAATSPTLMTDDLTQYFPSIVTTYGAGANVQVICKGAGAQAPLIKSTDTDLQGTGTLMCVMQVEKDGTWTDFLSFTGDVNAVGSLALMNPNMIKFVGTSATMSNVAIVNSAMTDVTTDEITKFANDEFANNLPLNRAIAIPISSYVNLVNPVISYHSGYVQIVSNADFQSLTCEAQ